MGLPYGTGWHSSVTSIYSCPQADFGSGPTGSLATLLKGMPIMGSGMGRAVADFLGEVYWH